MYIFTKCFTNKKRQKSAKKKKSQWQLAISISETKTQTYRKNILHILISCNVHILKQTAGQDNNNNVFLTVFLWILNSVTENLSITFTVLESNLQKAA